MPRDCEAYLVALKSLPLGTKDTFCCLPWKARDVRVACAQRAQPANGVVPVVTEVGSRLCVRAVRVLRVRVRAPTHTRLPACRSARCV